MIKKINIKAFRGIHNWDLNLNNKSLVIFGENGTGKSSFIDAFEFFFTGDLRRLTSVQKISKNILPTIGCSEDDLKVELLLNESPLLERKYHGSIKPTPSSDLVRKFLSTAQNTSYILRRSQILEFILSVPSDRFRSIGDLIGIGDLDNLELAFNKTFKHFQNITLQKESVMDDSLNIITKILRIKKPKFNTLLESINKYLNIQKMDPLSNLEHLDEYCQLLARKIPLPKSSEKSREEIFVLDKIKNILESIIPEEISKKCQNYYSKCIDFRKKYPSSPINLQFLKGGLEIVKTLKEEEIYCPFCEQLNLRKELQNRVSEKLSLYKKLSTESTNLEKAEQQISINLINISKKIKKILVDKISPDLKKSLNSINRYLNLILKRIEKKNSFESHEFDELHNNIVLSLDILKKDRDIVEIKISKHRLSKEQLHIYEILKNLNQIQPSVDLLISESQSIKLDKKRENVSKKMLDDFSRVKKEEIQNIYNEIQSTIQDFFAKIHPLEDLKNIKLEMTRTRSTILNVDFLSRNHEDPRAYASEGHLDTMGLCIFLAFNKKFLSNFSFMILDDILSSIDANHRRRITNLILDEFTDKQLIITTHDLIWFNEIKARQRAKRIQAKFINQEIVNWHCTTGPEIKNSPAKKEYILDQIESNNHHIGNLIRVYIENVLKNICNKFEAKVKYKPDNRYTLGEYLDSLKSRINKLLSTCDLKTEFLDAFLRFDSISFISNILSHANVEYDSICMDEIEEFANSVFNLENSFKCSDCNKDLLYSSLIAKIKCETPECVCIKQTDTH